MAQTALQLDLHALREEVSFFMGKGRVWNDIAEDEQWSINAIINAGLRMFYGAYPWSFLYLDATISLEKGVWKYDLPDDFGFMNGAVCITDGTVTWCAAQVSQTEIEFGNKNVQRVPKWYAVYPKKMEDDAVGQGWEIAVWPVPDRTLTLQYRYNVQPRAIDEHAPYPYGGMYHSETIREACLAKAESETDDQPGVHQQHYQTALQNSIDFDKAQSTPDSLGYNGDGRRIPAEKRRITLKMNGVEIGVPEPTPVPKPIIWEE